MTKWQRIKGFFAGLIVLIGGLVIALMGEKAVTLIMGILALSLTINGLRTLLYYFKMARHMVDGDQILIRGILLFDLGSFTATITQYSGVYVIVYLFVIHAFSGFIDILRALEEKGYDASRWKLTMSSGIINIAVGIACIVFMKTTSIAVYIYSAGVIYYAITKIAMSFKKTAVVYVNQ